MSITRVTALRSSLLLLLIFISYIGSLQHIVLALNSKLDINGTFPYLINSTTGQIIQPRDYMDFQNIYTPNETYKAIQTVQGRNYHLLKAFDFANYFQSDYWHYSNQRDLELSAKPVADTDRCAQQLNWLEAKLNNSASELFRSGQQHSNLMTYLDSFGRLEAGTYNGHGYWLGSYHECLSTTINMLEYEQEQCKNNTNSRNTTDECQKQLLLNKSQQRSPVMKMRYCIGKGRDIDWPNSKQDNYQPMISYKIGLCLPETCETLSFSKHRQQIERIWRINMPQYSRDRVLLHDMYCLPDNRSPIRALSLSARVFLCLCAAWLLISIVATSLYSCYRKHQQDLKNIVITTKTASTTTNQLQEEQQQVKVELINNQQVNQKPESQYMLNCMAGNEQPVIMMSNEQSSLPLAAKTTNILANRAQLLFVKTAQTALSMVVQDSNNTTHNSFTTDINSSPLINAATTDNDSNNQQMLSSTPISYKTASTSSLSVSSLTSRLNLNLNETKLMVLVLKSLSIRQNLNDFVKPPKMLRQPGMGKQIRINLNALDCIKCLSCVLVIFGHVVFINMQHLTNIMHAIEESQQIYPRLLIGLFNFVDTFFIISGMLTAYFIFKRFNQYTFAKPIVWFNIILLRLLRLSPVYLLVLWFIKTLGVYLSDGPIWDYGTDKNSIKGLCINDNWWKSILYLGNVNTMQPLCVLPAWSIILDVQYSIIIPPVLYLIFKHKKMGYFALLVAIIVTTIKMSIELANQTAVSLDDMGKARLHVYPLISRFAVEFYNSAWNRIGPVAIGIIGGHMLHLYDLGSIRTWPFFMRGLSFKIVLLLHALILIMPSIGLLTESKESSNYSKDNNNNNNNHGDETGIAIFVFSNSTIKPIWSVINTILLLRLITDLRSSSVVAKLMSHNIWHCLGKLCFTSYLIHFEVILYLLKSRQTGLADLDWPYVYREFTLAFLISTTLSYFVHVLYEAPINNLIMLAFSKPDFMTNKQQHQLQKDTTSSTMGDNSDGSKRAQTSGQED